MGLGVSRDVSSNFGIPSSVTNGVNVDVTGDATGNAVFKIDMTTRSIPVEVTTSVRLLTLLTAYGGLGFDWQLGGGSALDLAMNASMIAHIPGQPDANLGTAFVHATSHVGPQRGKGFAASWARRSICADPPLRPTQRRQHQPHHGQRGRGRARGVLEQAGTKAAVNETVVRPDPRVSHRDPGVQRRSGLAAALAPRARRDGCLAGGAEVWFVDDGSRTPPRR